MITTVLSINTFEVSTICNCCGKVELPQNLCFATIYYDKGKKAEVTACKTCMAAQHTGSFFFYLQLSEYSEKSPGKIQNIQNITCMGKRLDMLQILWYN